MPWPSRRRGGWIRVPWVCRSTDEWRARVRGAETPAVTAVVAQILADVRQGGDAAVRGWTRRLDRVDRPTSRVAWTDAPALPPALADALALAGERIRAFATWSRPPVARDGLSGGGLTVRTVWEPLGRVAVYVPAGRFPLASTLLMGVIPAQVAGVRDIVVLTPPRADGEPDPVTLAAAAWLGIQEVHAIGGAQAVGATAYGTESVRPVDALVGPGNVYVTEAKRQVAHQIRIDGLNGPSEVVVWGEPPASAAQAARDLLAQAEHDPASVALAVSQDVAWLDEVGRIACALSPALTSQPGVGGVVVTTPDEAVRFVNALAPEHLELWGPAGVYADELTHAGATFIDCPSPLGDYVAGPNHVLPTGGRARRQSVLGVEDFLRRRTETRQVGNPERLADQAAVLAAAEGLERHHDALAAFAAAEASRSVSAEAVTRQAPQGVAR